MTSIPTRRYREKWSVWPRSMMMNNPHPSIPSEDEELLRILDDVRQTCSECSHPRCRSIRRSVVKSIEDYAQKKYQEGELKGRIAEVHECGWSDAKEKYPTYARKRLAELEKLESHLKEGETSNE